MMMSSFRTSSSACFVADIGFVTVRYMSNMTDVETKKTKRKTCDSMCTRIKTYIHEVPITAKPCRCSSESECSKRAQRTTESACLHDVGQSELIGMICLKRVLSLMRLRSDEMRESNE